MKFIIGQKQEMSQIYNEDKVIPITIIKVDTCKITQIKTNEKDGYEAVQIGSVKKRKINKALRGHLKNENFRYIKEFRTDGSIFKIGDVLDIESFESGEKINVIGVSKGKGFQGVVKRHGFGGQPTTHGTKDQVRMPGSIGATGPAHVFKGTRMPGQMGNCQSTVTNLEIIEIDKKNNSIKVKGSIPGHRNSVIFIKGKGDMKIIKKEEDKGVKEEDNRDIEEKKSRKISQESK